MSVLCHVVRAYLNCFILITLLCITQQTHLNLNTKIGACWPGDHLMGIGVILTPCSLMFICILKLITEDCVIGFLLFQCILAVAVVYHVSIFVVSVFDTQDGDVTCLGEM